MNRVAVGFSGGIDSVTAVGMLCSQGFDVTAVYIDMTGDTEAAGRARLAAVRLGVRFDTVNAQQTFEKNVISRFVDGYASGRTPNPCVDCNRLVKIELLYDYARANGIDRIATGHYAAAVRASNGRFTVRRALDTAKDQSYMLLRLTQEQLSVLLTPLSNTEKSALDLPEGYRESQDVCFIPDGNTAAFVTARRADAGRPGPIVDESGHRLGTHRGICTCTVGQRRGLGVAAGGRIYVTDIDAGSNTVTVGPDAKTKRFEVSEVNLMACTEPDGDFEVCTRYRAVPVRCRVNRMSSSTLEVITEIPCIAAPGQSAVFYRGNELCMGGFIQPGQKSNNTDERNCG